MKEMFSFHQKGLDLIIKLMRARKLKQAVKAQPNLFLPAGDTTSLEPLIFGTYEHGLTELVSFFSKQGYRSAFFDIGANIGLSSFYCGAHFEKIFCFEPNSQLIDVLRANTNSVKHKTTIFNYGLGNEDKSTVLVVPKHNLGGGYIRDANQSLSLDELAAKDRLHRNSIHDKYISTPVNIKTGRTVLTDILSKLDAKSNVLFKVDVEGYEKVILTEIAHALRSTHCAVIIFENFSQDITPAYIRTIFNKDVKIQRLTNNLQELNSNVSKILRTLMFGRVYSLEDDPKTLLGQVVLTVE